MIWGSDIQSTSEGLLVFGEEIIHPEPDVRRLTDAAQVLYEEIPLDDRPLYYMYRGVSAASDREAFLIHELRYDLTVILPGRVGREYFKTVGHFHPLKPQGRETYPEYYEVLAGEAIYLLQKNSPTGDVEEIMAVGATAGDKVYIPPNYGHVTINPGEECLVMANLVERNFKSIYEPFRDKHGAAYYYLAWDKGKAEFIRNPHYRSSVALQMIPAPSLPQPIETAKAKGLYAAFIASPDTFNFLK